MTMIPTITRGMMMDLLVSLLRCSYTTVFFVSRSLPDSSAMAQL